MGGEWESSHVQANSMTHTASRIHDGQCSRVQGIHTIHMRLQGEVPCHWELTPKFSQPWDREETVLYPGLAAEDNDLLPPEP